MRIWNITASLSKFVFPFSCPLSLLCFAMMAAIPRTSHVREEQRDDRCGSPIISVRGSQRQKMFATMLGVVQR